MTRKVIPEAQTTHLNSKTNTIAACTRKLADTTVSHKSTNLDNKSLQLAALHGSHEDLDEDTRACNREGLSPPSTTTKSNRSLTPL